MERYKANIAKGKAKVEAGREKVKEVWRNDMEKYKENIAKGKAAVGKLVPGKKKVKNEIDESPQEDPEEAEEGGEDIYEAED
jgi:hypothetical protein